MAADQSARVRATASRFAHQLALSGVTSLTALFGAIAPGPSAGAAHGAGSRTLPDSAITPDGEGKGGIGSRRPTASVSYQSALPQSSLPGAKDWGIALGSKLNACEIGVSRRPVVAS